MKTVVNRQKVYAIKELVDSWAVEHALEDYNYGSRASYWGAALGKGIITREQYELGREFYGNLWTYRGD